MTESIPHFVTNVPPDSAFYSQHNGNGDGRRQQQSPPPSDTPNDDSSAGSETPNKFAPWQPVSIATYAETPLPDRRYVVDRLVPASGVTVFHAAPGQLKTQLLLDLASCVATGEEWLPKLPAGADDVPDSTPDSQTYSFATVKTPVLWLNFDMADSDMHERSAAVFRTRPLRDGDVLDVVSLPDVWLDMSSAFDAAQLAEWIVARGYQLVVLDNAGNVKGKTKLIDESVGDMIANVRRLSKLAGCAVLLIHHETKSIDGKSPQQRMFGGVQLAAGVDAAFSLTRAKDIVTLTASKQRGYMQVEKFCCRYTYSHSDTTNATLDKFKFFAASVQDAMAASATSQPAPLQQQLLDVLQQHSGEWLSVPEIAIALDKRTETVRTVLKRLAATGRIAEAQTPQRFKYDK